MEVQKGTKNFKNVWRRILEVRSIKVPNMRPTYIGDLVKPFVGMALR
jgi:hypothetical protein